MVMFLGNNCLLGNLLKCCFRKPVEALYSSGTKDCEKVSALPTIKTALLQCSWICTMGPESQLAPVDELASVLCESEMELQSGVRHWPPLLHKFLFFQMPKKGFRFEVF